MEKCPADDCNYIYFDERAAMAHYEDVHKPLESMSSPDAEDMAADTDTDDNEEEASEEEEEVKLGSPDPMFKLAMEICPSYHRREFEFDLWNNRPDTSDEAIDRAIVMRMRETPSTSSLL